MGRYGYSRPPRGEGEVAASATDLDVSYKEMVELCRYLRGMRLEEAKRALEEIAALRRPVPFRRFHGGVGHRRGLTGWKAGRYPRKAATMMLKLLASAEANAVDRGLDRGSLRVIHAAAHKSRNIRSFFPRAQGRATPKTRQMVRVEVILGGSK